MIVEDIGFGIHSKITISKKGVTSLSLREFTIVEVTDINQQILY